MKASGANWIAKIQGRQQQVMERLHGSVLPRSQRSGSCASSSMAGALFSCGAACPASFVVALSRPCCRALATRSAANVPHLGRSNFRQRERLDVPERANSRNARSFGSTAHVRRPNLAVHEAIVASSGASSTNCWAILARSRSASSGRRATLAPNSDKSWSGVVSTHSGRTWPSLRQLRPNAGELGQLCGDSGRPAGAAAPPAASPAMAGFSGGIVINRGGVRR